LCSAAPTTEAQKYITETNTITGNKRLIELKHGAVSLSAPVVTQEPDNKMLATIRSFLLPQGWPHSVAPDYLKYQLYTYPCHITGWMSQGEYSFIRHQSLAAGSKHLSCEAAIISPTNMPPFPLAALAGSSMLKALGVGTGPAGAVGFSAAIKWVTKDGVGAAGRLFVGLKLSRVFDEDPKRWRMIAEAVTTVGLALEIATQLSPANFVALAGAGTLAKATGKGMGRPCFRVVQTHFSRENNVGDVAAKEEVWELTAQLIGLAASVALLTALEAAGTPEAVIPVWAGVHATHVALRYSAVTQLRFPWPNMKRGVALVRTHIKDSSILSVDAANEDEPVLHGPEAVGLRCLIGCSLEDALGLSTTFDRATNFAAHKEDENRNVTKNTDISLQALIDVYRDERYLLTQRNGAVFVVLWEDAGGVDMMRALWQAAWIHDCMVLHGTAATWEDTKVSGGGVPSDVEVLKLSLGHMQQRFPQLLTDATAVGWELHRAVLPTGSFRLTETQ